MPARPDDLVPENVLTPAQRAALRTAAARDPEFAAALAHWSDLQSALCLDLDRSESGRHLFALCALAEGGHADVLTPDEYILVDAVRAEFRRAVRRHPGLSEAAAHICAAIHDLDALWEAHEAGQLVPGTPATKTSVPWRRWIRWVGMGVALAVFVSWIGLLVERDSGGEVYRAGSEPIEVALNEAQRVMLAPAASMRSYEGEGGTRGVRLAGRAVFEVAYPIRVEAEQAVVSILSGQVAVSAEEGEVVVHVLTGVAQVALRGTRETFVRIEGGERSTVRGWRAPTPAETAAPPPWTPTVLRSTR